MWIVDIAFTAAPERLAARPAHRERLTALHATGVVRMAGPLADDSGAVIVLEVSGRAAVDGFLAADPYFRMPGVEVRGVREWRPFLR
ncbi:YciI family protein [Actinoplanes philippinensis]|uniref:YciI family protein n=1 Tax=Actinoplanes philippinensis TaxID=35752 RepID=UPI0033E32CEB